MTEFKDNTTYKRATVRIVIAMINVIFTNLVLFFVDFVLLKTSFKSKKIKRHNYNNDSSSEEISVLTYLDSMARSE